MVARSRTKSTAVAAKKTPVARRVRRAPVASKAATTKQVVARVRAVVAKPTVAAKKSAPAPVKPAAAKKTKLVRDNFTFPKHEHAQLAELKKRAQKLGQAFKKSEILRAGLAHLTNLADSALLAALAKVERVKTGRPAKKSKKK